MIDRLSPPSPSTGLPLEGVVSTGAAARCTRLAIYDDQQRPCPTVSQGQTIHVWVEFEAAEAIEVALGSVGLCDISTGVIMAGSSSWQRSEEAVASVPAGGRVRFVFSFPVRLSAVTYGLTVGLWRSSADAWARYQAGTMTGEAFAETIEPSVTLANVAAVTVAAAPAGAGATHDGWFDLGATIAVGSVAAPGSGAEVPPASGAEMPPASGAAVPPASAAAASSEFTVFHLTHPRAGSQWIRKILTLLAGPRVVAPRADRAQFFCGPLRAGAVYPALFVSRQEFESRIRPAGSQSLVIIRDPRDTLVSGYFSVKVSHRIDEAPMGSLRRQLLDLDGRDPGVAEGVGLIHLMDEWLWKVAEIIVSWIESGEEVIRYEDLLERDVEILVPRLSGRLGLATPQRVEQIVRECRFEQLTRGRARGQEDVTRHERKGIAGDWRNYFNAKVKDAFKARYGGLLVAAGYEKDLDW